MFVAAIVGVFALSAFASSLASATTAGWMVNGSQLTGTAALANTAAVDGPNGGTLTAAQVKVHCSGTTLKGENPKINGATGMGDASSLEFTGCVGEGACPLGEHQGTTVKTLPVLVDLTLNGATADKGVFLATNSSKLFATIEFGGTECSFAGVNGVTGTQGFLAPTGQTENAVQLLEAETLTTGELKLASAAATLKGAILVKLASGLPFSFL